MKKNKIMKLVLVISVMLLMIGCNNSDEKTNDKKVTDNKVTDNKTKENISETKKIESVAADKKVKKPEGLDVIKDISLLKERKTDQKYNQETDTPLYERSITNITMIDNLCYYTDSTNLYSYDLIGQRDYFLCNKPNCKHDSTNCNAINTGVISIFSYEKELYGVREENAKEKETGLYVSTISLVKISKDGSGINVIKDFKKMEIDVSNRSEMDIRAIGHRGYVYFYYVRGGVDSLGKDMYLNESNCLFRYKIDGSEELELIKAFENDTISYKVTLKAFGSYLFLLEIDDITNTNLFLYDTENNEIYDLKSINVDFYEFVFIDNYLVYRTNETVEKLDLKTKEKEVILKVKENESLTYLALLGDDIILSTEIIKDPYEVEDIIEYTIDIEGNILDKKTTADKITGEMEMSYRINKDFRMVSIFSEEKMFEFVKIED